MPIGSLPNELLLLTMRFLVASGRRANYLKKCCLVCRRWLTVVQPMLFERVILRRCSALAKLRESLVRSHRLGRYVFSMNIEFVARRQRTTGYLPMDKMIADCLRKTSELREFSSKGESSFYLTQTVVGRMCSLPKLKKVALKPVHEFGDLDRRDLDTWDDEDSNAETEKDEYGASPPTFNASFLLRLTRTIESLDLWNPSRRTLDLLPQLCSNLQRHHLPSTAPDAMRPDLSINAGDHVLRPVGAGSFSLHIDRSFYHQSLLLPAFVPSVSSILTSFTFQADGVMDDQSILISLLSATPLLEYFELSDMILSPSLFENLPRLEKLRTFILRSCMSSSTLETSGFYESLLPNFLRHSPLLNTFEFSYLTRRSPVFTDELIKGVIQSTRCQSAVSRLRSLYLGGFGEPSIETIEQLCDSAPLLSNLSLLVPRNNVERAAAAIGSLRYLVSAELNDLTLTRYIGGDNINLKPLLNSFLPK